MTVKSSYGSVKVEQQTRSSEVGVWATLILFWTAVIAGVTALIFPALGAILWALITHLPSFSTLIAPGSHLFLDLLFGAGAGLAIGLLRWRWGKRKEVAEELVSAMALPEVVNFQRVELASAALHVAAGMAAGLATAFIGAHLSGVFDSRLIVPDSPAYMASIAAGGAGGFGGADSPVSLLLGLSIVIVLVSIVLAVIVHGSIACVAGGGLSGAARGLGQGVGAATVLALTRLFSTELTAEARVARGLEPLTLTRAIDGYTGRPGASLDPLIERYFRWLMAKGHVVTPESIVSEYGKWSADPERRGGNTPRYVDRFVWHVEAELRRRAPTQRLIDPGVAPSIDSNADTLFYPGWFRKALLAGVTMGAMSGLVEAILLLALMPLVSK